MTDLFAAVELEAGFRVWLPVVNGMRKASGIPAIRSIRGARGSYVMAWLQPKNETIISREA